MFRIGYLLSRTFVLQQEVSSGLGGACSNNLIVPYVYDSSCSSLMLPFVTPQCIYSIAQLSTAFSLSHESLTFDVSFFQKNYHREYASTHMKVLTTWCVKDAKVGRPPSVKLVDFSPNTSPPYLHPYVRPSREQQRRHHRITGPIKSSKKKKKKNRRESVDIDLP